jgi:hypothetical protein
MEALGSSETSFLTRETLRNIAEGSILFICFLCLNGCACAIICFGQLSNRINVKVTELKHSASV